MTIFEYLSVAVSIVLSLSATQLLLNVRSIFDSATRYWVHIVWVLILLSTHILTWWGLWAYRVVESWTLFTFSLLLVNPGILFVASSTLVNKPSHQNWEEHFYSIRTSFFGFYILIPIGSVFRDWVLLDLPILNLVRVPEFVMTAIILTALLSNLRKIQAYAAVAASLLFFVFSALIWLQPGAGRILVG